MLILKSLYLIILFCVIVIGQVFQISNNGGDLLSTSQGIQYLFRGSQWERVEKQIESHSLSTWYTHCIAWLSFKFTSVTPWQKFTLRLKLQQKSLSPILTTTFFHNCNVFFNSFIYGQQFSQLFFLINRWENLKGPYTLYTKLQDFPEKAG